jgi:hypothetical protein
MVMVVPLVLLVFVLLLISLLLARIGAATVQVPLQILGLALRGGRHVLKRRRAESPESTP